ncbi:hypothetical protein V1511DRAFT_496711 [Dipodascopsis uninucleata]
MDPDAPRRPQTVYFAFANEARKLIRNEYIARGIETSNKEIIKEVAERWKNMTEEQKEPWKALYAEQIKKYDEEKAAYNAEKEKKARDISTVKDQETVIEKPEVSTPVSSTSKKSKQKKPESIISTNSANGDSASVTAPVPAADSSVSSIAPPSASPSKKKKKHKRDGSLSGNPPSESHPDSLRQSGEGQVGVLSTDTRAPTETQHSSKENKEKKKKKKKSESGISTL